MFTVKSVFFSEKFVIYCAIMALVLYQLIMACHVLWTTSAAVKLVAIFDALRVLPSSFNVAANDDFCRAMLCIIAAYAVAR